MQARMSIVTPLEVSQVSILAYEPGHANTMSAWILCELVLCVLC